MEQNRGISLFAVRRKKQGEGIHHQKHRPIVFRSSSRVKNGNSRYRTKCLAPISRKLTRSVRVELEFGGGKHCRKRSAAIGNCSPIPICSADKIRRVRDWQSRRGEKSFEFVIIVPRQKLRLPVDDRVDAARRSPPNIYGTVCRSFPRTNEWKQERYRHKLSVLTSIQRDPPEE